MTTSTRTEVGSLLDQHPDRDRWIRQNQGDASSRALFLAASTWPDSIRQDARFYTPEEEGPTPELPGFPEMNRHSNWHAEARQLDRHHRSTPTQKMQGRLGEALARLSGTLGNHHASPKDRSYALPWLIHLVGDSHQPLHLALRRSASGQWDWLGTRRQVHNPDSRRKPLSSLHAFWDDLPGPVWLRGEKLDEAIASLMTSQPLAGTEIMAPMHRWLEESWQLARSSAYPDSADEVATLSEAFRRHSRRIAQHRVVLAGNRLGATLNTLFDKHPANP